MPVKDFESAAKTAKILHLQTAQHGGGLDGQHSAGLGLPGHGIDEEPTENADAGILYEGKMIMVKAPVGAS
jgi:hypothetical protein